MTSLCMDICQQTASILRALCLLYKLKGVVFPPLLFPVDAIM